jgi:site-specific DNA-methyltransferase (adenine-specific)
VNRALFSSASVDWRTPEDLRLALDAEFRFTLDACPLGGANTCILEQDGLARSWTGKRVFCNPPYRRGEIARWLAKAREAEVAVYLLPSRTGTPWFHDYALKADEIRFIRGRLRFSGATVSAPFDSLILVFGVAPREGGP